MRLALLLAVTAPALSAAEPTWADLARPAVRPPGFPAPSAVCFSSRWKRPINAQDPHDTFQAAAAFHATGFWWCNGPNGDYFRDIVRRGYSCQGWLATILPDTLWGNTRQQGRILDAQGELVTGPWMRSFKGWWGCVNSPEWRRVYLDYIKAYLDAGCTSLQMDDPGQNAAAVAWGGCYCPHCRAKAARLGQQPREIQEPSTHEFYREMRRAMNEYAGRHVPWSCNAAPGERPFYPDIFDFGLRELAEHEARPARLHATLSAVEQLGKGLLFTLVSRDRRLTRGAIATAYALGTQVVVPWDVYIATDAPRQFGEPADYADLYGLARGAAAYLDGYTEAALIRPLPGPAPDAALPVTVTGGSADLAVFVRAQRGQADAPVVIHLVDPSEAPQACTVRLHPARLFGRRGARIELLRPAPYDAAAHARAEQTKDFAPLVQRTVLASGFNPTLDLPAPTPWAMLVISPLEQPGRWPPYIAPTVASLADPTLQVTLAGAADDEALHYTLDDSTPTAASPRYSAPLRLTADTTVRALAVAPGGASAVSAVRFRKRGNPREEAVPDSLSDLRLWLRAAQLTPALGEGAEVRQWPARVGPALVSDGFRLYDQRPATPPQLLQRGIGGQPTVRFSRPTDLLSTPGFANRWLRGAFTIFVVSAAADDVFGLCGNGAAGGGGIPRLYLTRQGLTYHATRLELTTEQPAGSLLTYLHDGQQTVEVRDNGGPPQRASGPQFAPGAEFGSGGHLAVPFWAGNVPHLGDLSEVVVYSRALPPAERSAVERHLLRLYRLRTEAVWE
ncbi:MAG: chitobiase/beta-hexosaminidase C-terminal domain-containing protein [Fimbriimonadaceae bacterium]|nr:chitobiase/beta-hexosaminidase C-terminal domain-containing protein [Fimbriimonadaceae bacterium]